MPNLLLIAHTPSDNTRRLADAVRLGASHPDLEGLTLRVRKPLQAQAKDVCWADGLILGTPENFGYMSGALKDFFDRIYYPCLERTQGLPYALWVRAGNDGRGARESVERIVQGLRWRAVQDALILRGDYDPNFEQLCEELGLAMAAGLEAGVF